jgi:hypothetical protein
MQVGSTEELGASRFQHEMKNAAPVMARHFDFSQVFGGASVGAASSSDEC